MWADAHEKLRAMARQALDNIETFIKDGDIKSSFELLKLSGIASILQPPGGACEPHLVAHGLAKTWAESELRRPPPSADPFLAELEIVAGTATASLAQKRYLDLVAEYGLNNSE